ncbi:MAG: hypothetical protein ACKVHH_00410 [Candidatus Poseidoniales archaeon]
MSPIASVKEQPQRAKSLVFSLMMILSAFSAGIPMASAAGQNGEWIQVDMTQGHWAIGSTVEANISGGSLDSIPGYTVEWKLEDMNMTIIDSGGWNISAPASGDTFEYNLSWSTLGDDCFNLIGELFDNGGAFVDGSSMSFEVGAGMCQGTGGPSGPHMWWNGSYWFDTNESIVFFAEVEGLDEASSYTLDWEVVEGANPIDGNSEAISGVGQNTSIEIQVQELAESCYEIKGSLSDSEGKEIPGSEANYMFEVGNGTCQTGPPSMISANVNYYDGELSIWSSVFEQNQSSLNIQVSIFDAAGTVIYYLDMDFTADEHGWFDWSDASATFDAGEYPMDVKITDITDDSILFEASNLTLTVYDTWAQPEIYVWLENYDSEPGMETIVNYSVFTNNQENISAFMVLMDDDSGAELQNIDLNLSLTTQSLGILDDGNYKVEVILMGIDAVGNASEHARDSFTFCLGAKCHTPVWETGNASLNLTIVWDDYDTTECEENVTIMLFHLEDLQNDRQDDGDNGDHEDDNGDHEDDNGNHMNDSGNHENDSGNHENDSGDNRGEGAQPVWATAIPGPSMMELTGIPEGNWVVYAIINCKDSEDEGYQGFGVSGGLMAMDDLEFINGSTTVAELTMRTMTNEDSGSGMDLFTETGYMFFHIMVEEDATGALHLTVETVIEFSDSAREMIDAPENGWGNGDGVVSEEEANSFRGFFASMMVEDREDGSGDIEDDETDESEETEDNDDGSPDFSWNGVLVSKENLLYEEMTLEGLVGPVPMTLAEDTESVYMVRQMTFLLTDNGEDVQTLTPVDETDETDETDDSGDCEYMTVYVHDSETWDVQTITDGGNVFIYDEDDTAWSFEYGCDEGPTDEISVTFSRVIAEPEPEPEPEPVVNTAPTCDVFWYGSDDVLADGTSGGNKAVEGTGTGDFDIELTEGETYTLMFYCIDAEGDSMTVTVNPSIGENETMTGNGTLSGYYEFTIPTGVSVLSGMSFDYDWTDGTNSDDGTVSVKVLEGTATDDTKSDDTSAGSFVPGFTAVLTMTALAGAFLVFSRRQEE